jgi:hypothetical protein
MDGAVGPGHFDDPEEPGKAASRGLRNSRGDVPGRGAGAAWVVLRQVRHASFLPGITGNYIRPNRDRIKAKMP